MQVPPSSKRAFTLIEMLIATMIFVIGFVSVYGMFLAGSKYRKRSDSLTQAALAVTSLIETLRLQAGVESGGPYAPEEYDGDGDPTNNDSGPETGFVPFPDQPRLWYRFANSADLTGTASTAEPGALGFRTVLQVIDLGATPSASDGSYELSVADIGTRLRISRDFDTVYVPSFTVDQKAIFEALPDDDAKIIFILRLRNLLLEQEAFILRRSL